MNLIDIINNALGRNQELKAPIPQNQVLGTRENLQQRRTDLADYKDALESMAKHEPKRQAIEQVRAGGWVPTPGAGQVKGVQAGLEAVYRHPRWEQAQQNNPKNFQELTSGTQIASEEFGVPQDLLMDISMIEANGIPQAQMGGGPGRGYYQYEMPLPQDLQQVADNMFGAGNFDPNSATQSARLTGNQVANQQLSRWGTPDGSWGSLDASRRAPEDRLTTYYGEEELNPYLAPKYQF